MGEKSKKRGEFGEDVVLKLLELIGWGEPLTGRDIECSNPLEHAISTRGRKEHGCDFIYRYNCPLHNNRVQFVVISSKYNDEYTSNPTSKFKPYLKDIATALECFKKSGIRNQLKKNYSVGREYNDAGVIFWFDNGKDVNDDVIERLSSSPIIENSEFDSVYLVDNKRADFLFESIMYAQNSYKNSEIEFLVPDIGYNHTGKARISSTNIMPIQFINSSILPIKIINEAPKYEYLLLNTIDDFEEEYLKRLISLAQKLTEGWGDKIFVLFPNYNENLHGEIVENAKLEFEDQRFIKKLEISTYNPTFRTIK